MKYENLFQNTKVGIRDAHEPFYVLLKDKFRLPTCDRFLWPTRTIIHTQKHLLMLIKLSV